MCHFPNTGMWVPEAQNVFVTFFLVVTQYHDHMYFVGERLYSGLQFQRKNPQGWGRYGGRSRKLSDPICIHTGSIGVGRKWSNFS